VRIKVSNNFYLDEFINPETYQKFEASSQRYIRPEVIKIAQFLREYLETPITINNWFDGGQYKESGLRDFNTSTGAKYSAHKFGAAIDVKTSLKPSELVKKIIDNEEMFMLTGLTRIEDTKFTSSWVHLDCLYTGLNKIQIIKP